MFKKKVTFFLLAFTLLCSLSAVAVIVRFQGNTDMMHSERDLTLTSDTTIVLYANPDDRNVLIDLLASYQLSADMAITPVNAHLYKAAVGDASDTVLNNKSREGFDADALTVYYLTTGTEMNGRLEVSASVGGSAIGWIESVHVNLPKICPQYCKTVTSDKVILLGEKYVVGCNGTKKHQQLRLPKIPHSAKCVKLAIYVPSGVTLHIKSLKVCHEVSAESVDKGILIDVHGAFFQYPEHTRKAFELAADCGASSLITIPKRSADGVWFCFHDDTFPGKNDRIRNADGSKITGSVHQDQAFNRIPFADLSDYVIYKNSNYEKENICLLSEFFDICAKKGAKPVLSFHPLYSTPGVPVIINGISREEREYVRDAMEIRTLAKQYGVLDKLSIKVASGAAVYDPADPECDFPLGHLFEVFGNEIDGYIVTLARKGTNPVGAVIDAFDFLRSAETPLTADATIELWADKAKEEEVAAITAAGYKASLFQAGAAYCAIDGEKRAMFNSNDYDYWRARGVTRFGTNKMGSMGLNW